GDAEERRRCDRVDAQDLARDSARVGECADLREGWRGVAELGVALDAEAARQLGVLAQHDEGPREGRGQAAVRGKEEVKELDLELGGLELLAGRAARGLEDAERAALAVAAGDLVLDVGAQAIARLDGLAVG